MPSSKKSLHYSASALLTSIAVGLLGYGMSTTWVKTSMTCARRGADIFNGSAVITLDLFNGNSERISCPFFGRPEEGFKVFSQLANPGGAPLILHGLVVGLSVLCLLFSCGSILISLYNTVSNPYETYMGPIGFYTCSSVSACSSFVALVVFVANVNLTNMAEDVVNTFAGDTPVVLKDKTVEIQIGYYLLIPYMVLSLLAIVLVHLYDHAAYTTKKEQQRPTEDAPKEIMMY
ncbi:clarin-3 [Polymixia lowei]